MSEPVKPLRVGDAVTIAVRRWLSRGREFYVTDFCRTHAEEWFNPSRGVMVLAAKDAWDRGHVLKAEEEGTVWMRGHGKEIDDALETIQRLIG